MIRREQFLHNEEKFPVSMNSGMGESGDGPSIVSEGLLQTLPWESQLPLWKPVFLIDDEKMVIPKIPLGSKISTIVCLGPLF